MSGERYAFTERTYANLAKAHVSPLSVMDVPLGRFRVRRHIGASLQIAGQNRTEIGWLWRWLKARTTSTP